LRRSAARFLKVRPVDIVLASTRLYSSLPLVGKHLEPFAGLTAMALWAGYYAPATIRAAINRRSMSADTPAQADEAQAALDDASDLFTRTGGSRVPPFGVAGVGSLWLGGLDLTHAGVAFIPLAGAHVSPSWLRSVWPCVVRNFHGRDPFPASDIQAVEQRVGDVIDDDPPPALILLLRCWS
jgi:hypothetical protein